MSLGCILGRRRRWGVRRGGRRRGLRRRRLRRGERRRGTRGGRRGRWGVEFESRGDIWGSGGFEPAVVSYGGRAPLVDLYYMYPYKMYQESMAIGTELSSTHKLY